MGGGHYAVNDCGYCKDTRQPGFDDFGKDCLGGCDSTLKEDRCGQCITESDQNWDNCVGCDNVANSGMEFNPCGYCIHSNSSDFGSYGYDCRNICNGGYQYDECGECRAQSDTDWNDCVGCDGVANSGMEYNECGSCVSSNDDNFDDYGKDCMGQCSSSVQNTHYIDECGQCLLVTDPSWNNCVPDNTDDTMELTKKESQLTTIIIGALKKRQDAIKERFDSLASTYHHMDNMDSNVNFTAMNRAPDERKKKNNTKDVVADDSGDDQPI